MIADAMPLLPLSRRVFLTQTTLLGAGALLLPRWLRAAPTEPERGFFTLRRFGPRWFFAAPDGSPFFSLGLNHIDSSPLRYPENVARWEQRYGNDQLRWIRESVAPNLRRWGFNSVGWVQEVSIRKRAHTPAFTFEEYQALDLPYCHLLPFSQTEQWNAWQRNPDYYSAEFEDWCDYVARASCSRMKDDPKLIGYFYVDCPTWVHTEPVTEWRGPLFDPALLKTDAGKAELTKLATRFYQVTHDAVRRYDRHHLILGDRYEANRPLPVEILQAAAPYVDVFCFQDFEQPAKQLAEWHRLTGKPVLWADGAHGITVPDDSGRYSEGNYSRQNGRWYADVLAQLRANPGCVGAHLCGAYLRNRFRKRGLLDEQENPDTEAVATITAANLAMTDWVRASAAH